MQPTRTRSFRLLACLQHPGPLLEGLVLVVSAKQLVPPHKGGGVVPIEVHVMEVMETGSWLRGAMVIGQCDGGVGDQWLVCTMAAETCLCQLALNCQMSIAKWHQCVRVHWCIWESRSVSFCIVHTVMYGEPEFTHSANTRAKWCTKHQHVQSLWPNILNIPWRQSKVPRNCLRWSILTA